MPPYFPLGGGDPTTPTGPVYNNPRGQPITPAPSTRAGGVTSRSPAGGTTRGGRSAAGGTTPRAKSQGPPHSEAWYARNRIDWIEIRAPKVQRPGYADTTLPIAAILSDEYLPDSAKGKNRPAIIYVYRFGAALEGLEKALFQDEKIVLASKLFHCFMVNAESLEADPVLRPCATDLAAIHVFGKDGRVAKSLTGAAGLSGAGLFAAMAEAFDAAESPTLGVRTEGLKKLWPKLDRVALEFRRLLDQREEIVTTTTCKECGKSHATKAVAPLDEKLRALEIEWQGLITDEMKLLDTSARRKAA